MEKYDFCEEMEVALGLSEFDTKTLLYRINGFLYACNMNLDEGYLGGMINNGNHYVYTTKKRDDKYFVAVNMTENKNKKRELVLFGNYDDFEFSFTNTYGKCIQRNKIKEIPFNISIIKDGFILKTKTIQKERTEFYIENDSKNHCHFYANILNFENILGLVKAFIENPKLVFDTYNEIMESKKIVFSDTDIKKAVIVDKEIEKPVNKLIKKLNCE